MQADSFKVNYRAGKREEAIQKKKSELRGNSDKRTASRVYWHNLRRNNRLHLSICPAWRHGKIAALLQQVQPRREAGTDSRFGVRGGALSYELPRSTSQRYTSQFFSLIDPLQRRPRGTDSERSNPPRFVRGAAILQMHRHSRRVQRLPQNDAG